MAKKGATRLRGVYGKPLAKKIGQPIALTPQQLQRAAAIFLDSIRAEIAKDISKVSGMKMRGEPVSLPKTLRFAESFRVEIRGESTLEIKSDWPTAEAHTRKDTDLDLSTTKADPSGPFHMTWLSQPSVPYARIVKQDGEVIIRTTPDPRDGDRYWIHPGFRRYTFLERGLKRGRERFVEAILPELVQTLLDSGDLFDG